MQIKGGHGKKVVELNIAEYIDHGYSEVEAKRIVKKLARKWYVKKYPDGDIPEYLLEETND